MARLLQRFGVENAVLLDGGGSSDMVARTPGDLKVSVVNTPSDGHERSIPNGFGFGVEQGSGELSGFDIRTVSNRVFPGLVRDFAAYGYDETLSPVSVANASVKWYVQPARLGTFDTRQPATDHAEATLYAGKSGVGEVEVRSSNIASRSEVMVLGDLDSLTFNPVSLSLVGKDATATVSLVGKDVEGFDASIDPRDARLDFDASLISVTPHDDGTFQVTALTDAQGDSTVLTATVLDKTASLQVTVGLKAEPLSDFEDSSGWSFVSIRARGSVSVISAADRPGATTDNHALELQYDFTGQPGTSAAYAVAEPQPITLPIGTKKLSMWVKGDGNEHWLRAMLRSKGTTNVPFTFIQSVDFTGWRKVEGDIPSGFEDPITLLRVYLVEPDTRKKDAGALVFDSLAAEVAQRGESLSPLIQDPFVIEQGRLPNKDWRFALASDLHTSAAAGYDSFPGRQAMKTVRQMRDAHPDFIILNGDVVDKNGQEDFRFFESMLEKELPPELPVYWVPGDHEAGVTATGTLDNFEQVTGRPTRQVFTHKGTRFILLNSALGSLRLSDWSQIPWFEEQLKSAESDRGVKDVVVVFHHPLKDPTGAGASELSDALEAELIRDWLTGFRQRSGKNVALLTGHAHDAAVTREDGLLEVTTPSTGKTPYASPGRGGFFGWDLVGLDPHPRHLKTGIPNPDSLGWMQGEVTPLIDEIELTTPDSLSVGETASAVATGINSEFGLRFPLRYPATVTYSGSSGLEIDSEASGGARNDRGVIARLALDTMEIIGVRPGIVELTVSSGGLTRSTTITVK